MAQDCSTADIFELIFCDDNQNEEAILLLCEDGSKESILVAENFTNREPLSCLRNLFLKLLQLPDDELNRWIDDECGPSLVEFTIELGSSLTYHNKDDYSSLLQTIGDFVIYILGNKGSYLRTIDSILTFLLTPNQSFSFVSDLILYIITRLPGSVACSIFSILFNCLKSIYFEIPLEPEEENNSDAYSVDSVQAVKLLLLLRRAFVYFNEDEIDSLKQQFPITDYIDLWKHIYNL